MLSAPNNKHLLLSNAGYAYNTH